MVSRSSSSSTLKSFRFIPGAATSMTKSLSFSTTFTAGSVAPGIHQSVSREPNQSRVKKSSKNEGRLGKVVPLPFDFTRSLILQPSCLNKIKDQTVIANGSRSCDSLRKQHADGK